VFALADELHEDSAAGIDPAAWAGCDVERWRSAISRGYYALFLHLKIALLDSGFLKFPFPESGAHSAVSRAVRAALKPYHPVAQKLVSLKLEREFADYSIALDVDKSYAQDRLDEAYDAMGAIDSLKPVQLQAIADKLEGR
jgi:uncharacterized protein (UPF0332 family)